MSDTTGSYRDLVVWQQAVDLAVAVYETSRGWPREELYGLISQVRRAATSVPSNMRKDMSEKVAEPTSRFCALPKALSKNWRPNC